VLTIKQPPARRDAIDCRTPGPHTARHTRRRLPQFIWSL